MIKKILSLAFLLLAAALHAADLPGLKVGEKAADFTLKRSGGDDVVLADLLAKGPVALVFVRSADWCPFCRRQLQDLQKDLKAIEATGVRLIAVSYDSLTTNATAATKLGLTFPLLSDPGSKVIDAYGIRNHEAKGKAAGIPHPVVYLIDQQGKIRVKLMRESYRERPESAEIIAGVKSLL
ncbi:MAG: peroxiredoxin family protein [Verrucomicrobia bacterium]|nr:peroxiredoxin family protein [Verrucomicrobiota bacterium]